MKIKVILFGATGMVGEGVLHEALRHPDIESVLVVGRRACEVRHQKLKELVHGDFFDYSTIDGILRGYDACFFCLGASSLGMNEKEYVRVTYDLTMEAARTLSRLNPAMTLCYVSGAGTDSTERGRSMWARVKGKTENDLMKLPFRAVYLMRPGFIKPTRGLRNALLLSRAIGMVYPAWKILFPKYVCTLEDLGRAMIHLAFWGSAKHVLECEDITRLGGTDSRLAPDSGAAVR